MPENDGTAKPPPDRLPGGPPTRALPGFWVRAASAFVMLPLAVLGVYLGGWWLAVFLSAIGLYATYEWNRMTGTGGLVLIAVNVITFITMIGLLLGHQPLLACGVLAVGGVIAGCLSFLLKTGHRRRSSLWPALGLVYIGTAVLGLVWMRETYGEWHVFWLLILIWATDVGAYITGSLVGGPKLAPRFSPKKTWSGFAGGALMAALMSTLFGLWAGLGNAIWLFPLGLILAAWSQLGDIIESMIKRRYNVKDSGRLIPGHGGVLDRIDSLIFTVPVVVLGLLMFFGAGATLNG